MAPGYLYALQTSCRHGFRCKLGRTSAQDPHRHLHIRYGDILDDAAPLWLYRTSNVVRDKRLLKRLLTAHRAASNRSLYDFADRDHFRLSMRKARPRLTRGGDISSVSTLAALQRDVEADRAALVTAGLAHVPERARRLRLRSRSVYGVHLTAQGHGG